jgi:hypothetical protein
MNKNIFMKKHNPDVSEKFLEKNNDKINNINYTNQVWKGITGNEFNKKINKTEDFIINFEKPDISKIVSRYNDEYANREKEIKLINDKNKLIQRAALQSTMKIDINSDINTDSYSDNNIAMHDTLKKIQIAENDKLKLEKEKYNNLLADLENI